MFDEIVAGNLRHFDNKNIDISMKCDLSIVPRVSGGTRCLCALVWSARDKDLQRSLYTLQVFLKMAKVSELPTVFETQEILFWRAWIIIYGTSWELSGPICDGSR